MNIQGLVLAFCILVVSMWAHFVYFDNVLSWVVGTVTGMVTLAVLIYDWG